MVLDDGWEVCGDIVVIIFLPSQTQSADISLIPYFHEKNNHLEFGKHNDAKVLINLIFREDSDFQKIDFRSSE